MMKLVFIALLVMFCNARAKTTMYCTPIQYKGLEYIYCPHNKSFYTAAEKISDDDLLEKLLDKVKKMRPTPTPKPVPNFIDTDSQTNSN